MGFLITSLDTYTTGLRKAGIVLLTCIGLAACDPVPSGPAECATPEACEVAQLAAQFAKEDIGSDIGGGVILRNALAHGSTFVLDATMPLTAAEAISPSYAMDLENFGRALAIGFCEGPDSQAFFDTGASFRGRVFSSDGKLVADRIIRSCRGGKK